MPLPSVVIVVLNWNGREDTLACLASLQRCTYPNRQVLVVDNGSADGSEAAIRAAHPQLPLLQTGSNLGFAGGNNCGIEWALRHGADWVLLLNNDTEVEPDFVDAMVQRAAGHDRVGVVGAAIAYASQPRRLWAYGGGRFDVATGRVRHVQQVVPDQALRPRGTTRFYVTGCTMLLRRQLLEQVGNLDTRYFHFCEDADLCFRAQSAGWEVVVTPAARLIHKVSATTRVSSPLFLYYNLRSRLQLVRRFGPAGAPTRAALIVLWLRLWRPALQSGMGVAGWRALRRALKDFRAGAQGPAPADLAPPRATANAGGPSAAARAWVMAAATAGLVALGAGGTGAARADLAVQLRALWGGADAAPSRVEELLWRMAEDPARAQHVVGRAGAAQRALTDTLLAVLRWGEPQARRSLPDLYVVHDFGPPPGQRPPAWHDVRRQGLRLLPRIALDAQDPFDGLMLRRLDPLPPGERRSASVIGGQVQLWDEWWARRGMDPGFYLDSSRVPDPAPWLALLRDDGEDPHATRRLPGPDAEPALRALSTPLGRLLRGLVDDPVRRGSVLAALSPDRDQHLVAEAMQLLPPYQQEFEAAGIPPRTWDPATGRASGYRADDLRAVCLGILDRVSGRLASGATEDEVILDWLRWWSRARFEARFYRAPREAPSLAPMLEGMERTTAQGGRPFGAFLRDVMLAGGHRELLLDRWAQTVGPANVAELIEWLRMDRRGAIAAGFDPDWRILPLRPLPGETGQPGSIPWDTARQTLGEMLRRATGEVGLPDDGVDPAARDAFWEQWWDVHRVEPQWHRAGAAPPAPRFAPQRARTG